MKLTNQESKLLSSYQQWIKKNKLNSKYNVYFIEQNSTLVFQIWDLENQNSENVWYKEDNGKWIYCISSTNNHIFKFFLLTEILNFEKEYTFKNIINI